MNARLTCGTPRNPAPCAQCHLPRSDWPKSRNARADYCSAACKNQANQAAWRERQKGAK